MRGDDDMSTNREGRSGDGRKESREYRTEQEGREEDDQGVHGVNQPGEEEPEEQERLKEGKQRSRYSLSEQGDEETGNKPWCCKQLQTEHGASRRRRHSEREQGEQRERQGRMPPSPWR